ncbi:MAG: hypothetical protein ACRDCW_02610 [Sarcina sp.]
MSKIVFNYGVVGSRKSGELLLTLHRNREVAGRTVLVLQSEVNARDGGKIKSRALKFEEDAIVVSKKDNIKDIYDGQELILIDEIQFFSKEHIDEIVDISIENNVLVFCYGLMSNFKGELFDTVKHLIPYCTKIIEIATVCECCGKRKATMNKMTVEPESDSEISVGNHFAGVCLKCFKEG